MFGRKQVEYRIVPDEVFAEKAWFKLQCRRADRIFFCFWHDIEDSSNVAYLARMAKTLIAIDRANGMESRLLTDIDLFKKNLRGAE